MIKSIVILANWMLIVGYMLHALNFYVTRQNNLSAAMVLFAAAMYFLFR